MKLYSYIFNHFFQYEHFQLIEVTDLLTDASQGISDTGRLRRDPNEPCDQDHLLEWKFLPHLVGCSCHDLCLPTPCLSMHHQRNTGAAADVAVNLICDIRTVLHVHIMALALA